MDDSDIPSSNTSSALSEKYVNTGPACLTTLPAELLEKVLSYLDCLTLASCHSVSPVLAKIIGSPSFLNHLASTRLHCSCITFLDIPELSSFQELWYLTQCSFCYPHMGVVFTRRPALHEFLVFSSLSYSQMHKNDSVSSKHHRQKHLALKSQKSKQKPVILRNMPREMKHHAHTHKHKKQKHNQDLEEPMDQAVLIDDDDSLVGGTVNSSSDLQVLLEQQNAVNTKHLAGPSSELKECTKLSKQQTELGKIYATDSECSCVLSSLNLQSCNVMLCGRHAVLHLGALINALVAFLVAAGSIILLPSATSYPDPFSPHLDIKMQSMPKVFASFVCFALAFPELLEAHQSRLAKLTLHCGGPEEFNALLEAGWSGEMEPAGSLEMVLMVAPFGPFWLMLALAVYWDKDGSFLVWSGTLDSDTLSVLRTSGAMSFPSDIVPVVLRNAVAPFVLPVLDPTREILSNVYPLYTQGIFPHHTLILPTFSAKSILVSSLSSDLHYAASKLAHLCKTEPYITTFEIRLIQFLHSLTIINKHKKEKMPGAVAVDDWKPLSDDGKIPGCSRYLNNKKRKGIQSEKLHELVNKQGKTRAAGSVGKPLPEAIFHCLQHVINSLFLEEVYWFLSDRVCHRYLCEPLCQKSWDDLFPLKIPSACLRVSPDCLPLEFWPPHLLCQAGCVLPAVVGILEMDIILWIDGRGDKILTSDAQNSLCKTLNHSGLVPRIRVSSQWHPPLVHLIQLQS